MRDPGRIDHTLKLVEILWKRYPDMRLGQLIAALTRGRADQFLMEDDVLQIEIARVLLSGWPVDNAEPVEQTEEAQ